MIISVRGARAIHKHGVRTATDDAAGRGPHVGRARPAGIRRHRVLGRVGAGVRRHPGNRPWPLGARRAVGPAGPYPVERQVRKMGRSVFTLYTHNYLYCTTNPRPFLDHGHPSKRKL